MRVKDIAKQPMDKKKVKVNPQINFTRNLNLGMSVNYSFLYASISVIPVIVFNIIEPREKVISTSTDDHFLELVMLTMYIINHCQ